MDKDRIFSLLAYAPVVCLMVFIKSLNIFSLKKDEVPSFPLVILIFAIVLLLERYSHHASLKSDSYAFSHLAYSLKTILTYFGVNIAFLASVFLIKTLPGAAVGKAIGVVLILFFAISMYAVYFLWVWVAYRFLKGFVFVVRGEAIKNSWIF